MELTPKTITVPSRHRVYFDTEFTGLHRNTSLISIGLVSESGAHFYAEFNDYPENQVDDWLQKHVIENLVYGTLHEYQKNSSLQRIVPETGGMVSLRSSVLKGDRASIKIELLDWLKELCEISHREKIQLISDCYAYDWMLMNDLLCDNGIATNLPDFIDYIPIDLSTAFYMAGINPDIDREYFIGPEACKTLLEAFPIECETNPKHNSLWDAYVIRECFHVLHMRNTMFGFVPKDGRRVGFVTGGMEEPEKTVHITQGFADPLYREGES